MSHFGSAVEQALHCLLFLVDPKSEGLPSARDLAEFQGVSVSFVAKLFTKLEKSGIVSSGEGIKGGFALGRAASDVSVLEVVDAIEGIKPLFQCRNIRKNCVLFDNDPPDWSMRGVCAIHGVMIEAEKKMRESLAGVSLDDIAGKSATKIPTTFFTQADEWLHKRQTDRSPASRISKSKKQRTEN